MILEMEQSITRLKKGQEMESPKLGWGWGPQDDDCFPDEPIQKACPGGAQVVWVCVGTYHVNSST